jgi:quinate dehydrogenase
MPTDTDTLRQSYAYGDSTLAADARVKSLKTYLFGYPIAHSKAPVLHSTIYSNVGIPWTYTLIESTDKSDFIPKLRAPDCIGAAITMPHKIAFISEVDDLTEEGSMIGAINTVFMRKDREGRTRYIGTNTDCIGVREAFLQNCPGITARSKGAAALVIGGGGASRSAIYALWKWMGSSKIYLVNRLKSEVDATIEWFTNTNFDAELIYVASVEQASELVAPVLVVGTIPDTVPETPGEILAQNIARVFMEKELKGVVLEMCYHPSPTTAFFTLATDLGWEVLPGTEPMIHQGIAQQVLWQERPLSEFDVGRISQSVAEALKEHRIHNEQEI